LTDDVTVPAGITLTIQPGVDVLFAKTPSSSGGFDPNHTELLVSGTLIADAGPRNTDTEIRFISDAANPQTSDWGRIEIQFNGVGTFRNVRITHAMRCINARDNARVTVHGSRLEACGDFAGGAGGAIVRREDSILEVRDSLFLNNQAALYFMGNRSNTASTAHNNSIYLNNYGIYLKGTSNPTLTGNDIFDNDHGLFAFEQATTFVFNNIFESNHFYGLRIRGEAVLTDFRHNNIDNPEARSSGGFDLDYANSLVELQAIDNYWGPYTEAQIEAHIRHRLDDPALGLVRFVPFATSLFPVPEDVGYGMGNGDAPLFQALTSGKWGKWKIIENHLRGMR
jgi:parallel beta-helix repeat protein